VTGALLVLLAAPPALASGEAIEARILRTLQTGVAQGVDAAELLRYAKALDTPFEGHVLARAALVTLRRDEGFPEWPLTRLLDRVLDLLQSAGSHAFSDRPGVPPGFGGDDLVFTTVYALVMTRQAEAAIDVLERRLDSDSEFVRGVALQALRHIGTPRATRLIQKSAEAGRDRNLPENLLADLHYPFLTDLQQRLQLVPEERRERGDLLVLARGECGEARPSPATSSASCPRATTPSSAVPSWRCCARARPRLRPASTTATSRSARWLCARPRA